MKMENKIKPPSESIFEALEILQGATLQDVCSYISKNYGFQKQVIRDRLYYLESSNKVSAITITLGNTIRKLYCLPIHREQIMKLFEIIRSEVISFLDQRLVAVTPELIEYLRSKFKNASIGFIQLVLKSLVFKNEISRLSFLTSKNRIAYFYFLSKNTSLIDKHLNDISDYVQKNKYTNATTVASNLNVEVKLAAYLLRHLSYRGELNIMVEGYTVRYGQFTFIYYIPGYKEVVDKRHQIERQTEYFEHAKILFYFLAEQMTLRNKQEVILKACETLKICLEKGILQGRDLNKLAAGAFVFSIRKLNESASVSEVRKHLEALDIGFISEADILSTEKVIAQKLGMPLHHIPQHRVYIQKFVNALKIPENEQEILVQKSMEIFECLPSHFIFGKKPSTIAASVIYAAAMLIQESIKPNFLRVTQDMLSAVSGVTEVSIRNYYKIIERFYRISKGELKCP
jgi:transcription initiation factor TFIIIB Brf1 subunit/transcription initiation factor TFIIB